MGVVAKMIVAAWASEAVDPRPFVPRSERVFRLHARYTSTSCWFGIVVINNLCFRYTHLEVAEAVIWMGLKV